MKTGRSPAEARGAKWKACCWVTTSGGSETCRPISGSTQGPAATTTAGACHDRSAVRTSAPSAGPALGGLPGRYQLRGHPERPQDLVQLLLLAGRAEVDPARGQDELLPCLVGQLPPESLRLPGQLDVERVGVGPPENPGAAVRAAAPVPGLERLQDHCRTPAAGQRPRRGRSGQARSDDHHVDPVSAHGSTVTAANDHTVTGANHGHQSGRRPSSATIWPSGPPLDAATRGANAAPGRRRLSPSGTAWAIGRAATSTSGSRS